MRRSSKIKLALISLPVGMFVLLLPFFPEVPGCVMTSLQKKGRVVDATTGKGIPNALVIAAATKYANTAFSSGRDIYREITHTDDSGNYEVSSSWSATFDAYLETYPFLGHHSRWYVSVLKPGYADVRDHDTRLDYREDGTPKHWPTSVIVQPNGVREGLTMNVEPIVLEPVEMSVKDAAVYYSALSFTGSGTRGVGHREDQELLRQQFAAYLFPRLCADPTGEIDSATLQGIGAFVSKGEQFSLAVRDLAPSSIPDSPSARPKHFTRQVCKILQEIGDYQ